MYDSFFLEALNSVVEDLRQLGLPGLDSTDIKVRRLPTDGEVYHKGISVHPVTEIYDDGTNMREDIGYGCGITMVVNNNNNQLYLLDRLLRWREMIRRHFVEKTVLQVMTTLCQIKVEHGPVLDIGELIKRNNYDVSTMVIRVWSRETRS